MPISGTYWLDDDIKTVYLIEHETYPRVYFTDKENCYQHSCERLRPGKFTTIRTSPATEDLISALMRTGFGPLNLCLKVTRAVAVTQFFVKKSSASATVMGMCVA